MIGCDVNIVPYMQCFDDRSYPSYDSDYDTAKRSQSSAAMGYASKSIEYISLRKNVKSSNSTMLLLLLSMSIFWTFEWETPKTVCNHHSSLEVPQFVELATMQIAPPKCDGQVTIVSLIKVPCYNAIIAASTWIKW